MDKAGKIIEQAYRSELKKQMNKPKEVEVKEDYIRRADAIKAFENYLPIPQRHAVEKIMSVPSADVVEPIRCYNCKWYKEEDVGVGIYQWCELLLREVEIDWYCASGEVKR